MRCHSNVVTHMHRGKPTKQNNIFKTHENQEKILNHNLLRVLPLLLTILVTHELDLRR